MIKDYYSLLELPSTASKDEVKQSFRKLAKKWHPDVNPDKEAHSKFISINEAYLILSDDEARQKYHAEYKKYFGSKDYHTQNFSKSNTNANATVEDDELFEWINNAHQQAKEYSKMSFKDFKNLLDEILKEVGNQIFTASIYAGACIFLVSGIFSLIFGLIHLHTTHLFISIISIGLSYWGFTLTSKKYSA